MSNQQHWGETVYVTPSSEWDNQTPYWSHFDVIKDGNVQSECISVRGFSKEDVDKLVVIERAKWESEFKKSPLERLKNLANKENILDHDKEIMLKLITKILS